MRKNETNFSSLESLYIAALKEDIGSGDVTSESIIPETLKGSAKVIAKEDAVLCGMPVIKKIYKLIDPRIKIEEKKFDGMQIHRGDEIIVISGKIKSILIGERLALNFLQRLSGIATHTKKFADILGPYGAKIYDTRKTTPIWRTLEKYAVRTGGGENHRFGLYDMFLIKDNHIDAVGGAAKAILLAKSANKRGLKIMCEARSLDEVRQVLDAKADFVLLDNMTPRQIKAAMKMIQSKIGVEISGGITLKNIAGYAKLGVKRFSSGSLTHSSKAIDFSMLIKHV